MKIFSLIILSFFITNFNAQNFEGEIFFKINHDFKDSSLFNNRSLPNEMNYFISGEYAKIVQSTIIGNQSLVKDTLSGQTMLLINLMDEEVAIILENEKDTNEIIEISYKQDFKTILSYSCQKAIINTYNKVTEKNSTSIIYFTNEISNAYCNNFDQLKGFPLSYEISSDNITSTYSAKEIKSLKINPQEFEINKNTKTFTLKEFKKLMTQ